MERVTPVVLAIGTTHPLNVAGLGLDARVAGRLGIRIVTIVAGVSAQSASAVIARAPIDEALIEAQFEAVRHVHIGAIHVGALLAAASVRRIARLLAGCGSVPVVCDPVIAATSGDRLADDATVSALRDELFACCTLVTPNLVEAALMLKRPILDAESMEAAGHDLRQTGAAAVLLKGGHLPGDPTDVLIDGRGVRRFSAPRLETALRGTGDLLACAIAARLAYGDPLDRSIIAARSFVRECIAAGVSFAGTTTIQ